MTKITAGLAISAATMLLAGGLAAPAQALTFPAYRFANCTALNRTYPHGVMKKNYSQLYWSRHGATARPAWRPRVYWANASTMDRDHDGIACEK